MLNFEDKKRYFEKILEAKNDYLREELYLYFFTLEQGNFDFLHNCNNYNDIEQKTNYLISKIAKHEHEDCISNIIESYQG
jgi:hypothetical protein